MSGATTDRFDEIFSTSLQNYKTTLVDNIFDSLPFFEFIAKKGGSKVVLEDSAADIIVPLMYAENGTVSSYSGYDIIDTTPQSGLGNAKYTMKQVAGTVTIDRFSERQNAGKAQIVNLFQAKMTQLEKSMANKLSQMFFSDGTGNSSKDISGLQLIIADTPTSGTVGGIDRASYSWWRNNTDDGASSSTAFDAILADVRSMYYTCAKGKDAPDLLIGGLDSYKGFEGKLTGTLYFNAAQSNTISDAKFGFQNMRVYGSIFTYDNDCGSDRIYFINSAYLKFHVDKNTFFEAMPFQRMNNQDARTSMVLLYGELCASNCARLGVLEDIT